MNYSELQTALGDWSLRTDLSAFFPTAIELATAMFNHGMADVKALRTRQMVTTVDLSPSSGVYTLPSDYLQYLRVVEKANPRRELDYISPSQADQIYPFQEAGLSQSFTIIGSSLLSYPVSSNDIALSYYQAIPDLSDSVTTNWLLTKQPSLYIHGSLLQVAMYARDDELAARSTAVVTALIDGLNNSDAMSMFYGARSLARGVKP